MKSILIIAALFAGITSSHVMAQGDVEKMKVFESWAGQWEGEGSLQMGPGEPRKSKVKEIVQHKLGGMVLQVEGTGTAMVGNQETIVHQALGIVSFDKASNEYKFKTWLRDGKAGDAWLKMTGENQFQWGFDFPNRKIRYTIVIDPVKKTWNEIGESSADGNTWMKFFEMNLTKVQ